MRMLLVYRELRTGGAETLIVRLANYQVTRGVDVAVCCTGGELLEELDPAVTILRYTDPADAPSACAEWLGRSPIPVGLLSFDPISAASGLLIEASARTPAEILHICGVLHERAFFMSAERRDRIWLNWLVARAVGYGRLFFMNRETMDAHAQTWKVSLSGCATIPIPINNRHRVWQSSDRVGELRVICVGRLVDFKRYNVGVPSIVRECGERGLVLQWDIFGTGPVAGEIQNQIALNGVERQVRLAGELPYRLYGATVTKYDLFVGLGTAALEAAIVGVPVIAATDSSTNLSYGWLHELPFGNLGERQADFDPPHRIADLVLAYARLDGNERAKMSEECHKAAQRYSIAEVIGRLESLLEGAPKPPTRTFKAAVAAFYLFATNGTPVRLARRCRQQLTKGRSSLVNR